jgi:hypothetical protein
MRWSDDNLGDIDTIPLSAFDAVLTGEYDVASIS